MKNLPRLVLFALLLSAWLVVTQPVIAASISDYDIQRTWNRTDKPVADHQVSRTWMWGPEPFTDKFAEPFIEGNYYSTKGERQVQYFDKSRMEITNTDADHNSSWYITNGLLATELVTGRLQAGESGFQQYTPANVNASGDPNDPNAPTYASFTPLLNSTPLPVGSTITQTINRAGNVGQHYYQWRYEQIPGTRANPLPIGASSVVADEYHPEHTWQVHVEDITPNANAIVANENMFNDPPASGKQFFIARISATFTGSGSDRFDGSYRLRAVGNSAVSYSTFDNSCGVIPEDISDAETFTGGTVVGNVCWEVQSSDVGSLLMFDGSQLQSGRVYFALHR